MSEKIAQTRKILKAAIKEICSTSWMFARDPEKDFTRNRKISFRDILLFFLCKEGGNLTTELFRYFGLAPDSASISAFIQQRDKILPEAFITLFHISRSAPCWRLPHLQSNISFPPPTSTTGGISRAQRRRFATAGTVLLISFRKAPWRSLIVPTFLPIRCLPAKAPFPAAPM